MGFSKAIIDKEILMSYINNNKPLKRLFKADAVILEDKFSSYAYELYCNGNSNETLVTKLKEYNNENNSSN